MRRKSGSLWGALVSMVFLIMLASSVIMMVIIMAVFQFNVSVFTRYRPLMLISSTLLTSIVVGCVIAFIVSKRALAPITDLCRATTRVARGDFQVRLKENHKIGELAEMARDFNKMTQELSGMEKLRDDFIAGVSHEFKNPLAAIGGYAVLLQDPGLTEPEKAEYLRAILESTHRLSTLTSNILRLNRLEHQEIYLTAEYRLDEQLRQAVLCYETRWSEKKLEPEINLEPVTIQANQELLMQVWMNLLDNAVKFTDPGGRLTVSLTQTGASAVVSLSDTGIGMSEETRRRIFDQFFQGDPSRSGEGNGLGLSLVRKIIEVSGGTITADSAPGEGSRFTVTLPLRPGAQFTVSS